MLAFASPHPDEKVGRRSCATNWAILPVRVGMQATTVLSIQNIAQLAHLLRTNPANLAEVLKAARPLLRRTCFYLDPSAEEACARYRSSGRPPQTVSANVLLQAGASANTGAVPVQPRGACPDEAR